jgi:hypothetical protein
VRRRPVRKGGGVLRGRLGGCCAGRVQPWGGDQRRPVDRLDPQLRRRLRLSPNGQEAYVKAPNNDYQAGNTGAHFGGPGISDLGQGIALEGDTLAVGAFYESGGAAGPVVADASSAGPGAVYVFRRTGATWMSQKYLRASVPRPSSWFGGTVALAPDQSLFVGAEGESSNAKGVNGNQADASLTLAGAVYVY